MEKGFVRNKRIFILLICMITLLVSFAPVMQTSAKGATFTAMNDVYYTKADCKVYSEPTYTSIVLTTIGANIPVQVIGMYSNGWYRINIGVICYVKMDSVTTAGAIGTPADSQVADAKKIADELGYEFVCLTLNQQKTIKKDIYNSYVGKKVILYAKVDKELGVLFKMLYNDKITQDINLNYTKTTSNSNFGGRTINYTNGATTYLDGQLAIFQFKVGYDKMADIYPDGTTYMNSYFTEFSEFAYGATTIVSNIRVDEIEIQESLTDEMRKKMDRLKKGIKYKADDDSNYRSTLTRLRKDTEYVD